MYRTIHFPGGVLTLLGIIVLSFLIPGLTANAIGVSAWHAHLLLWILNQHGLAWLFLLLLYGAIGFAMLLGALMALYTAGFALMRALSEVKDWARETSLSFAKLLGELIAWPIEALAQRLQELFDRIAQHITQRRELLRLYREEYGEEFRTYADFLQFWRSLSQGDAHSKPDPLEQAYRLMGLSANCTKDQVKERFRTLIDKIHPDKVGPNELATQLIDAYKLVNQNRSWR